MHTGNPDQNFIGMQFNAQQIKNASNYDSQFVSTYDQQYNSFQNDNGHEGHTNTLRFIPCKNEERPKTSHAEYCSGIFVDIDEEETAVWNKDPTNNGALQRFSTAVENEAEGGLILKQKDVHLYELHDDVSRYDDRFR